MITNTYSTCIDQLINDYQADFHNSIKTHTTMIFQKKNILAKAAKFIIYQNFFLTLICILHTRMITNANIQQNGSYFIKTTNILVIYSQKKEKEIFES